MKRLVYLVLGFFLFTEFQPLLCMEQVNGEEVVGFNLEEELIELAKLQEQVSIYHEHGLRMTPQRMNVIKQLSQKSLIAVTAVLEYFHQNTEHIDATLTEDITGLEAYKKQLEKYLSGERISLTPDDIAAGLSFTIRILVYFQEKIVPIIDAIPAGTEPSAHTLTLKRWLLRSVILTTALAGCYYGGVWVGLWKGYHLLDFSTLRLVDAIIHTL